MTSTATQFPFDLSVYIGRFQPFHCGHFSMLQLALQRAPTVVVVLGSSFHARSNHNPFSWQERADMIRMSFPEADRNRLVFVPVRDYYENKRWSAAVQKAVERAVAGANRVTLLGHFKDASSSYLNLFPEWTLEDCPRVTDNDATAIRRTLFDTPPEFREAIFTIVQDMVPTGTYEYLQAWWGLPHAAVLHQESLDLQAYWKKWGQGPFDAADAVVVCQDHVLLIRRGKSPGRGLYALPGGFLDPNERFYDAAVRELKEETGLSFYDNTIDQFLADKELFDHPGRSLRARIKSVAFLFDLGNNRKPEVEANDDAMKDSAEWVHKSRLADLEPFMFEDHFHILNRFFGITKD